MFNRILCAVFFMGAGGWSANGVRAISEGRYWFAAADLTLAACAAVLGARSLDYVARSAGRRRTSDQHPEG